MVPRYHTFLESEARLLARDLLQDPSRLAHLISLKAGTILIRISYGHYVSTDDDPFLTLIRASMSVFTRSAAAGVWLVDSIHILKYLPPWLPGTKFLAKAKGWRDIVRKAVWAPYAKSKHSLESGGALLPNTCATALAAIGDGLSPDLEEQLVWAAGTMTAGGLETLIIGMLNLILALILNPAVQAKAQAEIDTVIGRDRLPTISDQASLPYVRSVVVEVFRLNPPIPLGVFHALSQDDIYQGTQEAKCTTLVIPASARHVPRLCMASARHVSRLRMACAWRMHGVCMAFCVNVSGFCARASKARRLLWEAWQVLSRATNVLFACLDILISRQSKLTLTQTSSVRHHCKLRRLLCGITPRLFLDASWTLGDSGGVLGNGIGVGAARARHIHLAASDWVGTRSISRAVRAGGPRMAAVRARSGVVSRGRSRGHRWAQEGCRMGRERGRDDEDGAGHGAGTRNAHGRIGAHSEHDHGRRGICAGRWRTSWRLRGCAGRRVDGCAGRAGSSPAGADLAQGRAGHGLRGATAGGGRRQAAAAGRRRRRAGGGGGWERIDLRSGGGVGWRLDGGTRRRGRD
ncbi:putative monooxygenase [Mycena sanguinolenta]|uniref:Putative monooxygenase n=1 Tax=Mycena sanguinolenta TaxID=230812 RepID=A0A8H6U1G3_9AGAR|nr:putative monooxygenase [Mycena sanguinolenta]